VQEESDDRAGFGQQPQHLLASKALALEAQRRWVDKYDSGDGCPVDDTSVVIVWLRCERGERAAAATRAQKEAQVEEAAAAQAEEEAAAAAADSGPNPGADRFPNPRVSPNPKP